MNLKEKYGPWAIVTGATSGIGRAMATELAAVNLNLVLISRNEDNLGKVATELKKNTI